MLKSNRLTRNKLNYKQLLSLSIQGILLTCSLSPVVTYADSVTTQVLPKIVVNAEKRESDLQAVPSSITAKTEQDIEDSNITSVTELSQYTPNLHIFTWGGRRDTNIFVRGIGPGLFTDPTVGFYVDGVNYTNNGAFDMDLLDIERIEVLRGPQGTLYGGNSLAGVVNITTKKPSNETEGKFSLTADDLSRKRLAANINTPLKKDELFFGFSFSGVKNDGYIDNISQSFEDFGQRDDITAKTKLRWTPNDQLETIFVVDYENFDGDSYAFGPTAQIRTNPDEINHDFRGVDDRDSIGTSLTVNWKGNIDFTSITSWRDWENINSADQDGTSTAASTFHSFSDEKQEQFSQELRWSANNSNLSWLGGLYAYDSDFETNSVNTFAGGATSPSDATRDNSGYALFGQVDFFIGDQLT